MSRRECVLLPILIVTIDPSKRHRQYIADDEAVWFNQKLLTNIPIKDTTEAARGRWFVVRVSPQK